MTGLRTLFAALTLAALLPVAAAGQPPAARSLAPYFVVEGGAPGVDTLPLKRTEVEATIAGVIADVRLTQVYRNEGSTPIDARYVFPVSTRAAVYALRLRVGDRVVDARIREKQQARREFDQARREGRSASLLEQKRPNVMQMAIANVLPRATTALQRAFPPRVQVRPRSGRVHPRGMSPGSRSRH